MFNLLAQLLLPYRSLVHRAGVLAFHILTLYTR